MTAIDTMDRKMRSHKTHSDPSRVKASKRSVMRMSSWAGPGTPEAGVGWTSLDVSTASTEEPRGSFLVHPLAHPLGPLRGTLRGTLPAAFAAS